MSNGKQHNWQVMGTGKGKIACEVVERVDEKKQNHFLVICFNLEKGHS